MKEYKVVVETITKAQERWADSYLLHGQIGCDNFSESIVYFNYERDFSLDNSDKFEDYYDQIRVSIQMTDKSQNVENIIIHQEIIER